jgi:hypothetical protein
MEVLLAIFEDISLSNVSFFHSIYLLTFRVKFRLTKKPIPKVACINAPCSCTSTSWIRLGYHRITPQDETYSSRSLMNICMIIFLFAMTTS